MGRINILDSSTSNKIAAGEVVERPSSVVKELVENSIDAEAKNIIIEIGEGGEKFINIIDDGSGIHPDDIEKAFSPHATSKISKIEDIYSIKTMGFRGEALASVAAVSKLTLKSRTRDFNFGKEIKISGGKVEKISEAASNVGTSICVSDIFYNVPARQKFLKSPQRETASISDIISRLALVNSDISFKYINNGKTVMTTYGTGSMKETIRSIYGRSIYENIIPFEKVSDIASVYGFIGNSEISRGSRNNQSIFVNKRYIKNKSITAAVENAFKSFLTINKFPFFILCLDIYPEFIDVNVHPTKSELKFRDDRYIYKLVFDAVHEALRQYLFKSFNKEDTSSESMPKTIVQIPIDLKSESNGNINEISSNNNYSHYISENNKENTNIHPKAEYTANNVNLNKENYLVTEKTNKTANYEISKTEGVPKFPSLNIIGQFHKTYIIAEYNDTLYMIDQHAAHEKILFEKFKKSILEKHVVSQLLLSPLVVELTPEDFAYYNDFKEIFENTGFKIEIFGDNTITIREVPVILGKPNLKNLFMDILDNLKNMGTGEKDAVKYNSIATQACKAAIKANDPLSDIEMKSLIEELRYIEDPFTCPHGRPTIIKMDLYDIEKKFKRIQ
ncbi:DNA mismatch repair endonuclease MutL [Clostridium sp. JN-9]|uniref:DNA mismatch repair endonuclease MutL n=1 Tax=Clostridium sp. JN-9 TaxID=2507159 RepID=UPI000FFE2197|nr:DNA mismatch repair endonuclease MutL [Clostridium sp. JN-9]QAT40231.1 DNA mismatch repair endonuclease MutL [Clostridium sp. JN-9]